jgi:polyhydroxyalkanoate synthesis regulator phasin
MTDEELIARMRSVLTFKDLRLCPTAADRIEQLVVTNEALIAEQSNLAVAAHRQGYDQARAVSSELRRAMAERIMEHEAKLAKALEALENVIGEYDLFRKDEYERGLAPLDDEIHEARATLAEIKGERHE